jgi:hypothetical protein
MFVLVGVTALPGFARAAQPLRRARTAHGAPVPQPVPAGTTDLGTIPVRTWSDVVVWTGTRLLTFGGTAAPGREANAGADYDPKTGTWRQWPAAPFHPALTGAAAVWTGRELVVAGVLCKNVTANEADDLRCAPNTATAASYDPATARWHELQAPPFPPGFDDGGFGTAVGWNGSRALFFIANRGLYGYSPGHDDWKAMPKAAGASGNFCMVGRQVFSLDVAVQRLRPGARSWEADPGGGPPAWSASCTDNGVVAADDTLSHVAYLDAASATWRDLPPAPRELLVDPVLRAAGVTAPLPPRYGFSAWTGRYVLFASSPAESASVVALDPPHWHVGVGRQRPGLGPLRLRVVALDRRLAAPAPSARRRRAARRVPPRPPVRTAAVKSPDSPGRRRTVGRYTSRRPEPDGPPEGRDHARPRSEVDRGNPIAGGRRNNRGAARTG